MEKKVLGQKWSSLFVDERRKKFYDRNGLAYLSMNGEKSFITLVPIVFYCFSLTIYPSD
jgi:hypothetical protein